MPKAASTRSQASSKPLTERRKAGPKKAAPGAASEEALPVAKSARSGAKSGAKSDAKVGAKVGAKKPEAANLPPAASNPARPAAPDPVPTAEHDAVDKASPPSADALDLSELGLDGEALRRMEDLSVNLAKAAMTAQSALAGIILKSRGHEEMETPPIDPFEAAPALTDVMTSLASKPDRIVEAQSELLQGYLSLWSQMTQRVLKPETSSDADAKPRGDRRFSDPTWSQNLVFETMKESYLLSSNWLNKLVSSVDGVDPKAKRRVEFLTRLMTDAFSPSNFLMSNPAALQALIDSRGESLVRGMQQFAEDLARGDGRLAITQADTSAFQVGDNVATTPGKVVWRNDFFELIQYAPATEKVRDVPLLIFPPWINKFYILDLQPKNSMIRWLTEQGFTVFVTSWVNPDASMREASFEDYMFGGIYEAVEKVKAQTGSARVNTVGYCIGGTLLGATLGHMAEKGYDTVGSATFFTAQHDFTEAGDLALFTTESWLKELERKMDLAGGVLPGSAMADTFNTLRSNDLIWAYFVNNYLMGKNPAAFDLLCWNSDQTRMPKALHMFYLRRFYGENALSKGELMLGGVRIDLSKVTIPIFEQAGREDHIAPPGSVYKGTRMFGGPVTYVLAGSGHIAGVVNPPASHKYQHWLNPNVVEAGLPERFEDWFAGASEHQGSWWPYWASWLHERSGEWVPARDPAAGPLAPVMDAPGSYVLVKC